MRQIDRAERNGRGCEILLATAFTLAGCGGGGGVASTPPPPAPPPTAPPTLIPAATTSQQFVSLGSNYTDTFGAPALLGPDDQLQVRYDAATKLYEIQRPGDQTWSAIHYDPKESVNFEAYSTPFGHLYFWDTKTNYSRLIQLNDAANFWIDAIGLATPAGDVPVTGSAAYAGQLLGTSTEGHLQPGAYYVDGVINLSFDFGAGSLSGSITPDMHRGYDLGMINFRDTVYSTGSPSFSGKFDINVNGVNTFSGRLAGPHAEEVIGSFAFPYLSPVDGQAYQADGAFVGKRP